VRGTRKDRFVSLSKKAIGEGRVLSEEDTEELLVVDKVNDTASLSNGVHSQHGCTDVDGLDAGLGSDQGSDRRAAS